MKEQFKRLLENGEFETAKAFIKNTELCEQEMIEIQLEVLEAQYNFLVESMPERKIGTNPVTTR